MRQALATRLAERRLRQARIGIAPLLRAAGLSAIQVSNPDMRSGVASQIAFLDLAARALGDPLLGFRLAHDLELRQIGLLHYVAASSATLGDALERVGRFTSIVNAGVVVTCPTTGDFAVNLQYAGVARHSDRQQMEFLVTAFVRACRQLTGQRRRSPSILFTCDRATRPSSKDSSSVASPSERTRIQSSSTGKHGSFHSSARIHTSTGCCCDTARRRCPTEVRM